MASRAGQLRQMFKRPGIIRLIGAHNALGARIGERAGFDGIWSSSFEISASHAVPDAGLLTMTEFLEAAQSMVSAVRIPVVADVDTGFGNAANVIRTVQKFEAAGVAAICMEDKLFPKVNSLVGGRQELVPIAEFVGKIMAAKSAQSDPEFMLIARVEALIAGLGVEEALRRADQYVEAGADAILIHDKNPEPEAIIRFARAWRARAPLVVVPTTFYRVTVQQLEQLGIKMVIYANQGLRAAIRAMERTYAEILKAGSSAPVEETIAPLSLVFELQGFPQLKSCEESFMSGGAGRIRAIIPAAGDHMHEHSIRNLTAEIPIAMLDINGKPLLQRQVEALRACGIGEITVVAGYKREKIRLEGIQLAANEEWPTTGDMHSIICGAQDSDAATIIAYSDILFDQATVEKLLSSNGDINLLVDTSYRPETYARRRRPTLVTLASPRSTPRVLAANPQNRVLRIGQNIEPAHAQAEYTGLAFFSKQGFALLRQVYQEALAERQNSPFHEAVSARMASLTDVLQELIDRGVPVGCIEVTSGWMEIHSFADYKLAHQLTE